MLPLLTFVTNYIVMNMSEQQLTSAFEKYITEKHNHLAMFNQCLVAGYDKEARMKLKLCGGTKEQVNELFDIFKEFIGALPPLNLDEGVKATM